MADPDLEQQPNSSLQRKALPLCALGEVTKFEPEESHQEEEAIEASTGGDKYINYVGRQYKIDIEITLFPSQLKPSNGAIVAFTGVEDVSFAGEGGALNVLIRGGVKGPAGNGGRAKRITFQGYVNANLPAQT